jgi:hypothetical protein
MINRQRALVRPFANEEGRITKLQLVKLSFLFQTTANGVPRSGLANSSLSPRTVLLHFEP